MVIIKYPAANAFLNAINPINIPGYGEVSSNNSEAFLKYMTFDVPTSTLRAGETAVVYHQFIKLQQIQANKKHWLKQESNNTSKET